MFLANLVRGRMAVAEPVFTFSQPDTDNETEVRHFLNHISSVLRLPQWPEAAELRKGLETLVDLTETRKSFVREVYGEGWEKVLEKAGEGLVAPLLDVTLNCVSLLPAVPPLLPVLWKLLEVQDPMVRFTVLKILQFLCSSTKEVLLSYLNSDPTV